MVMDIFLIAPMTFHCTQRPIVNAVCLALAGSREYFLKRPHRQAFSNISKKKYCVNNNIYAEVKYTDLFSFSFVYCFPLILTLMKQFYCITYHKK